MKYEQLDGLRGCLPPESALAIGTEMPGLAPQSRRLDPFATLERPCATIASGPTRSRSRSKSFLTEDALECRRFLLAHPTQVQQLDCDTFESFEYQEWSLGSIGLNFIEIAAAREFALVKSRPAEWYEFKFISKGSCKVQGAFGRAEMGPGGVLIVDPDACITERWTGQMSLLVLRVTKRAIECLTSSKDHRPSKDRVIFEAVTADPGLKKWLELITCSVSAEQSDLLADHRVGHSIEQALITMLLSGFRHSHSQRSSNLEPGPAPYYVKRAEQYIRANARNPISIDDLVDCAKVSARTLFYGFNRWRGKPPMAYLRDTRLDMAKRELVQARDTGTSISQIAINSGFSSFSLFSRIYKERFGERPSATLRGC
jgi:AraC-like DNA-binding protein